jgi:DNA (cytosine-5)-methyltransferase 1
MHNTSANNAGKVFEEYSTCLDANSPPPAVFHPIAFHPTQDPINSTEVCHSIGANSNATAAVAQPLGFSGRGDGSDALEGITPTMRSLAQGADGHQSGSAGLAVAQPIGIFQDSEFGVAQYDSAGTLRAGRIPEHQMVMQPVVAPTLTASNDPSRSPQSTEVTNQVASVYEASMAVRRLTPVECERLQGFPDNYTAIPWRKKPASECPDGPRYKALGNSWAVPNVRWIGKRIQEQICNA